MARFITLSPGFWLGRLVVFREALPQLMTFVARQRHGVAGLLLAPAFLAIVLLFLLSIVGMARIYRRHLFAAGLLVFVSVGFLLGLACAGLINIRFRATVAPIVIPLISVTAHYYWRRLGLPVIVLRPRAESHPLVRERRPQT
jgi:uncharacterized protein YacL